MQHLTVAVTGGAGGLGEAIVRSFRQAGANVLLGDHDQRALMSAQARDPELNTVCIDFSDKAAADELITAAMERFGRLDVLINNVGVSGAISGIEDSDPEEWEDIFRINLFSAVRCTRAALPGMRKNGFGVVINVSSASTRTIPLMRSSYVVTKSALESFTRTVAREAGPMGIRCNAILPGPMRSKRLLDVLRGTDPDGGKSDADLEASVTRFVALRRLTEMSEVAETIAFLCSEPGLAITGQCIAVDGDCIVE